MANLDQISSNVNEKNVQPLPFDTNKRTKPIASAEKIRHAQQVPGTSDNDAETWRGHLQTQDDQTIGDVRDLQAATRNLHLVDEPGTWATATDAKVAVGSRTHNNGPILAPAAALWASATAVADVAVVTPSGVDFDGASGPGMNVVVQLPEGADIENYRLIRRNIRDDGTSAEGIVSSNRWIGALSPQGFNYPTAFSYREAFNADIGTQWARIVWTVEKHSEDIHNTEFDGILTGSIKDGEVDEPEWKSRHGSQDNPQTARRLGVLEDKTSSITFDDEKNVWSTSENTPVNGKFPLGQWAWVSSGGNAASYAGYDYASDFTAFSGSGFAGAGSGLLWVLPNNINWSKVRLVVRRADGSVRSTVIAQSLRNAPSSLSVANLPAAPPDHTIRWSASSDTEPYAVSNIEDTDTITLETLNESHDPVWGSDISENLRERVAANEVQIASVNQQLRNDLANPVFRDIEEIDDNSDWDGSTERFRIYSHTINDVKDGDFVELDWLNFNTTTEELQHFAVHGSSESQGRFIFHGRDLAQRSAARPNTAAGSTTSHDNGFIGATSGVLRRQSGANLVDDPGGAVMWWYLYRVGTTVHLDASASIARNPQGAGKMPEGFYLRSRSWRSSARVQSTRLLPDRPNAVEDRRGLVPKFDASGIMVYSQPIVPVQLLAFRSRITGAWTLGTATDEIQLSDLGQSGTTLYINSRSALASKSFGLIVNVERNSEEVSSVILPWALFRTGATAYVTGGGHGTQGVPLGYWSPNDNAFLVGHCAWAADHNRFEFSVQGPSTDTNSLLRVHLAR